MKFFNEQYFPDKKELVCPPADSFTINSVFFRFSVNSNVSGEADWKFKGSNSNMRQRWAKSRDYKSMCKGNGLSCFPSYEEALKAVRTISKRAQGFKRKYRGIFEVEIKDTDGKVADTSNANNDYLHFTLWVLKKSKLMKHPYRCLEIKY